MWEKLKYGLIGLIFLLISSFRAYIPLQELPMQTVTSSTLSFHSYSYISQKESNRQAVRDLYYIYSRTPKEVLTTDHTQLFSKKIIRTINNYIKEIISKGDMELLSFEHSFFYLHPDPIGYYIYALEKIVI